MDFFLKSVRDFFRVIYPFGRCCCRVEVEGLRFFLINWFRTLLGDGDNVRVTRAKKTMNKTSPYNICWCLHISYSEVQWWVGGAWWGEEWGVGWGVKWGDGHRHNSF